MTIPRCIFFPPGQELIIRAPTTTEPSNLFLGTPSQPITDLARNPGGTLVWTEYRAEAGGNDEHTIPVLTGIKVSQRPTVTRRCQRTILVLVLPPAPEYYISPQWHGRHSIYSCIVTPSPSLFNISSGHPTSLRCCPPLSPLFGQAGNFQRRVTRHFLGETPPLTKTIDPSALQWERVTLAVTD